MPFFARIYFLVRGLMKEQFEIIIANWRKERMAKPRGSDGGSVVTVRTTGLTTYIVIEIAEPEDSATVRKFDFENFISTDLKHRMSAKTKAKSREFSKKTKNSINLNKNKKMFNPRRFRYDLFQP